MLEAQRAADGRRQDHAEDDAADDDHYLLLQGDSSRKRRVNDGLLMQRIQRSSLFVRHISNGDAAQSASQNDTI